MGNDIKWNNFVKGDKKALELLFRGYYDELFFYGTKLTRSKSITEDCMQDLFLKLWINRAKLPHVKNHKAFLFTSFRNLIIDCLRWQQRFVDKDVLPDVHLDIEFSIEDVIIKNQENFEISKKIHVALNKLTAKQKEAIFLRFFDGLEFESIAEVMGINVQSVRNNIYRGVQSLRDVFPD